MIYYFSATGNSKYVAERIAEATGDIACSIEKVQEVKLQDGELFGLVCPTNWWELPILAREFLTNIPIQAAGHNYFFTVSTYGTTPGCSGEDARRILAQRGIVLNASFSVKMPDNWTPIFDLSDKDKVAKQVEAAEPQIDTIIAQIKSRTEGNKTQNKKPYWVRVFADPLLTYERQTKFLSVDAMTCIGCGLCAKKCPVQAIEMRDNPQAGEQNKLKKTPVWVPERCAMCLGCLHRCPKFAIRYGKNTPKHGQYKHPKTRV